MLNRLLTHRYTGVLPRLPTDLFTDGVVKYRWNERRIFALCVQKMLGSTLKCATMSLMLVVPAVGRERLDVDAVRP